MKQFDLNMNGSIDKFLSKPKDEPLNFVQPKLWELVKACENDKENWLQRYGEVKATIQVNFTEHANGKYRHLIKSDENLLKMVTEILTYFDKAKTDLDLCLDKISSVATKNGSISIKEIRDICTPILTPNTDCQP